MVSSSRSASQLTIVARPNQSATWSANVRMLLAVAVPSLVAAIGFALKGAWPILPFVGIELLALATALYYVQRKLQYRHIITLNGERLRVEKGFHRAQQTWRFQRNGTGLTVTQQKHPWDAPALALHDEHERVELGEFLNREDSLKLLTLLRKELHVRADCTAAERAF